MTSWEFPRCVVDHVADGDTIVLKSIDLGLDVIRKNIRVRFLEVNAAELDTTEGKAARDYLSTLVKPGDTLFIESSHWDKYANRIDGLVFTIDKAGTGGPGMELGLMMVQAGYAKEIK
jgi:endonuclease YncB( thermonuclease family)